MPAITEGMQSSDDAPAKTGDEVEIQTQHILQKLLHTGILGRLWPWERATLGVRVCRWMREELLPHMDRVVLLGHEGKTPPPSPLSTPLQIASGLRRLSYKNAVHIRWRSQGTAASLAALEGMRLSSEAWGHNVQHLDLCGNLFGNAGAEMLAGFLSVLKTIKHLDIGKNQIGAEGMGRLAPHLLHCQELKYLGLTSNKMGDRGTEQLSAVLGRCADLAYLGLAGNQIGDLGAAKLAAAMPSCRCLAHLDLRWNRIEPEGAGQVASVFAHCHALAHFDLGGNEIGDLGAARVATAMGRSRTRCVALTSLGLDANNIHDNGAGCLARVLGDCQVRDQMHTPVLPVQSVQRACVNAFNSTALCLPSGPSLTQRDCGFPGAGARRVGGEWDRG